MYQQQLCMFALSLDPHLTALSLDPHLTTLIATPTLGSGADFMHPGYLSSNLCEKSSLKNRKYT